MSDKGISELSAQARDIIRDGASTDGPSDQDRDRVRASVMLAIAGGAAATTAAATAEAAEATTAAASATGAAAGGTGMGLAAKLSIVVALAVGGGTGVFLAKSSSNNSASVAAPSAPAIPASVATPPSASPSAPPPSDSPIAAPEVEVEVEVEVDELVASRPARIKKPAAQRRMPEPKTAVDLSLAQLEQERSLLDLASKALRAGKPKRALEIIDKSATLFPKPSLAQERTATRILALCALGRYFKADAAIERFRHNYPSSAHGTRIARACRRSATD